MNASEFTTISSRCKYTDIHSVCLHEKVLLLICYCNVSIFCSLLLPLLSNFISPMLASFELYYCLRATLLISFEVISCCLLHQIYLYFTICINRQQVIVISFCVVWSTMVINCLIFSPLPSNRMKNMSSNLLLSLLLF